MRALLLGSVMALATASTSFAQEDPSSRTLDEQLSRVKQGRPAVTGEWTSNNAAKTVETSAAGEWPADPKLAQRKQVNAPAPVIQATPVTDHPQPVKAVTQEAAAVPTAPAGNGPIDSIGGGAIPALPLALQTAGDIRFITGGIGDEELAQLKAQENDFNLRLLLTAQHGEYVGDAVVGITDSAGKVLAVSESSGPYFYAHVPPGKYTVEITSREAGIKKLNLNVPSKGAVKQHVVFAE